MTKAKSLPVFQLRCHLSVWIPVWALLLTFGVATRAQVPPAGGTLALDNAPGGSPGANHNLGLMPVTIAVNIRESNGMLLEGHAFVRVSAPGKGFSQTLATQENSAAHFTVLAGGYDVEVSSAGYKTVTEHVNVMAGASDYPVFIYLHPESEPPTAGKPPAGMAITPKLQSELDKGMEKMRKRQYDAASQHFQKAAKIAPGNPDVPYLMGLMESTQKHYDLARGHFENALAIYPSHERSLLALGELQLQTGNTDAAVRTLEKAFAVNGADWKTHFLLAQAYNAEKDYAKGEKYALRSVELAKSNGAQPLLLLGRLYALDNKREGAKRAFALLIEEFPKDPATEQARAELATLAALPSASAGAGTATVPKAPAVTSVATELPSTLEVDSRPWAPPDVDSKDYPLAAGVACVQEQVLERAQKRMLNELQNFDKFTATERIEHEQVDARGNEGDLRVKEFSYLVVVRPFKNDSYFLEESRDGGAGVDGFPTNLATTGLMGLGVSVLEREYSNDFEYKCEGLSSWRGQAAWQVRFEQKKDVDSRIFRWRRGGTLFPVALKGRVWVGANSYDLLHMETDIREPIEKLALVRDHLIVDYGPVSFQNGAQQLWLPWKAEMFMEVRGKRYHHRHSLSNYMLFSVDTTNKIEKPKEAPETPEKEMKPPN